jgi:glycogen phosphorylase
MFVRSRAVVLALAAGLTLTCIARSSSAIPADDLRRLNGKTVAYFSLEMAGPELRGQRTGGLGIIAMDLVRGMARTLEPIGGKTYGVSLLYRRPWEQKINAAGEQQLQDMTVEPAEWVRKNILTPAKDSSGRLVEFPLAIDGKTYQVKVYLEKIGKASVLRLFAPGITESLYQGDKMLRLRQELLLARGGVEALIRMGIKPDVLHLNESHCGFVPYVARDSRDAHLRSAAVVPTTHTPVEAGLERFPIDWFSKTGLDRKYLPAFTRSGVLDLTQAMFKAGEVINAVSTEHAEVMRRLYPDFAGRIVANTNGVDPEFWQDGRITALAARKLKGKPLQDELWKTKQAMKRELIAEVRARTGRQLSEGAPILAFTRRVTEYKDTLPMLRDHVRKICGDRAQGGLGMQIVVAGVAHPADGVGQSWIKEFNKLMKDPALGGRFVFVPNYLGPSTDLELDRKAVRGSDLWLSSPRRAPRSSMSEEACGTSDMRSTLNVGVQIWSPDTGGGREYVRQYNPSTGEGNGFFIQPYSPAGLFAQLKTASDLFYGYRDSGDRRWLGLLEKSFQAIPKVEIAACVARQITRTYVPALDGRQLGAVSITQKAASQVRLDGKGVVSAEVEIGKLDPASLGKALKAEIWWGQPGKAWQATEMKLVSVEGGKARFSGEVEAAEAGQYGYTVRVAPRRGVNFRWAGADQKLEVHTNGMTDEQVRNVAALRWTTRFQRQLPGLGRGEVSKIVAATGGDIERMVSLLGSHGRGARQAGTLDALSRNLGWRPQVWSFTAAQKQSGVALRPYEPLVLRNATPFTVLSGADGHDPDIEVNAVRLDPKGDYVAVIRPGKGSRWMTFKWQKPQGVVGEGRNYSLQVNGASWRPQNHLQPRPATAR